MIRSVIFNQDLFFYFVRSGGVYLGRGYLKYMGRDGDYWTSTAGQNAGAARPLWLTPVGIDPSNNDTRYLGFSLRCLQE